MLRAKVLWGAWNLLYRSLFIAVSCQAEAFATHLTHSCPDAQVDSDDQYINDARSVRGLTLALVFMCMLTVTQMMQVCCIRRHANC